MLFKELHLSKSLLDALQTEGYTRPTPIQIQAIPPILAGQDVLGSAQTGTGKTAAFVLPILQNLSDSTSQAKPLRGAKPRALILTPTRELAIQVEESIRTYGQNLALRSAAVFGGVNINPQIQSLKQGLELLVATPGRLLDLVGQKALDLSRIEIFVLDEADRMLDMGFIHDIRKVIKLLPPRRQTLLFSATYSPEVQKLADPLLHKPVRVSVTPQNTAAEMVEQWAHLVSKDNKRKALSQLIHAKNWQQVLVFTRTKHGANRLSAQLEKDGISAAAIHGNKSQNARNHALSEFKNERIRVLVATDIASRGLDIEQLPQVVNYELSQVPEDYVHRIGRTGRAGCGGQAISLVAEEELNQLKSIERLIQKTIPLKTLAGEPLKVPAKTLASPPPARPQRPNTPKPAGNNQRWRSRPKSKA